MEKLELKHLAPYLPYGLKVNADIWNEELVGYTYEADGKHRVQILINRNKKQKKITYWTPQLEHVKPILRPLSDLTKDIIISGINRGLFFTPYDELKNVVSKEQWIKVCETIDVDGGEYSKICDMPHWWVEKLFEWHFDIFGLIEKGLAVDVNTIK